jgi:glycine oxidase
MRVGIVGAGIVGCACAFELARRGAEVTLFDSRLPGAGASRASAGILAPYIEGHPGGALLELAVRGLKEYDRLVHDVRAVAGVPFAYQRCGSIEIADSEQCADVLRSRTMPVQETGIFEWLDSEEVRDHEPAVTTSQFGGLVCHVHGYVAVRPFIDALVRGAERYGAAMRSSTVVKAALESGQCVLETIDGRQSFDRIVLSTGSWASFLDPLKEIQSAVRPIKGQLLELSWGGQDIHRVLWGSSCYVVPWPGGTLLVGATSEDVGFDERPTVEGIQGLLAAASQLLPDLGSATFNEVRVGLRPASADGLPIIRPSAADPRVFYATGHFRNGVLLAPITAAIVANYLIEGKDDRTFRRQNGA